MARNPRPSREAEAAPECEPRLDAEAMQWILGNVPACVWKYSPLRQRLLFLSDYVRELSGLSREALLQDPSLWDACVGQDPASREAHACAAQALREGRPYEVVYRFHTPHHGVRWFKVAARPVAEDGEIFFYGSATDVTARQKTEDETRRLAAALEQADEAFIITDAEGRIDYVNAAFERITGYTREEALGQRPNILKSGLQDEALYRELWGSITSGVPWRGRFINRRKDGSIYEQWATITPLHGGASDQAIIGFVSVQMDMTHQLELERRLGQAERLAAVGEAITGAAHTIKNILNTMRGSAFMIDRALDDEDPERAREIWDLHARSTARLDQLTRRMLDFVRINQLDLAPADLNALAREVLESCRSEADRDRVKLSLVPAALLPQIACDRELLHDAILNLVANAVQACAGRARARVRLSTRLRRERGMVELCVADNGPGIPPENMELLFRPFFTTKGHGGNGLGLAMVQRAVQAHHGSIDVQSAPGCTCFTLTLPL